MLLPLAMDGVRPLLVLPQISAKGIHSVASVCTWYAWLWAGWHELHLFRLIED